MWNDKRGAGLTADDVEALVAQIFLPTTQHEIFDWDLTQSDQGNIDFNMMS